MEPHPDGTRTPVVPAQPKAEASSFGNGSVSVQQAVQTISGACLQLGSVFRDLRSDGSECSAFPEMVVIPAGSFMMGSPKTEKGRYEDEGPRHKVVIPHPFALGKFPVTFDEWDACVADGGCNGYMPEDAGWGRGRRPVINVSWEDAQSYVQWLNSKVRRLQTVSSGSDGPYRLPSEAEWEYAARAGTTTRYWWGNDIGKNNANCDRGGTKWDNRQTAPVGSFAANPFGLHDVHGNVWEWVQDHYHDNYTGAPANGSAWATYGCIGRVIRGGSWYNDPEDVRAALRGRLTPVLRNDSYAFRVTRTLSP